MSEERFGEELDFDGNPVAGSDPFAEPPGDDLAALHLYGERGPAHKALADEMIAIREERAAAEVARAALATATTEAALGDEFAESILGTSIADDYRLAMLAVDDSFYEKNRQAVNALGSRDRADGGLGWSENGPLGEIEPAAAEMVARFNAERDTNPQSILESVVADRAERVQRELIRNPGLAELNGKRWNANTRSIEDVLAPSRDASRLSSDEFSALLRAAKGEQVRPPEGHSPESWRAIVASFVGGQR